MSVNERGLLIRSGGGQNEEEAFLYPITEVDKVIGLKDYVDNAIKEYMSNNALKLNQYVTNLDELNPNDLNLGFGEIITIRLAPGTVPSPISNRNTSNDGTSNSLVGFLICEGGEAGSSTKPRNVSHTLVVTRAGNYTQIFVNKFYINRWFGWCKVSLSSDCENLYGNL